MILALAAIILTAYSLLLFWTGLRADLAESNLQANLIRISNYLHEPPANVALIGSSVAGRLMPEYFLEQGIDVRNLGLDGSRPLFVFEVLRMREELPKLLLVDTSALFQPLMSNDKTLRDSVHNPSFAAAQWIMPLRPSQRPSSVLYSMLKRRKDSAGSGIELRSYPHPDTSSPNSFKNLNPSWRPEDQYGSVSNALSDLLKSGAEVRLLSIPRGEGWGNPSGGLDRKLANELHIDFFEPGPHLAEKNFPLRFSDGIHLDVPSARQVAKEITQKLNE